jgi:16S rRNA (guanine527-N7)-methyltransferase
MFHVKHEGWVQEAAARLAHITEEQAALLQRYEDLLRDRGIAMGLIATSDLARLRERHVLDALRGASLLPPACRRVADLGSGAGLPGVPLAIACPSIDIVLVEARRRRAAFLEMVGDILGLDNMRVFPGRAEDLQPGFDACVARAFGSPAASWKAAGRVLVPGGVLLYWAGEGFDEASDVPADVLAEVPVTGTLAYGGPVVIMSAR